MAQLVNESGHPPDVTVLIVSTERDVNCVRRGSKEQDVNNVLRGSQERLVENARLASTGIIAVIILYATCLLPPTHGSVREVNVFTLGVYSQGGGATP